jgi:hypothetical protein
MQCGGDLRRSGDCTEWEGAHLVLVGNGYGNVLGMDGERGGNVTGTWLSGFPWGDRSRGMGNAD